MDYLINIYLFISNLAIACFWGAILADFWTELRNKIRPNPEPMSKPHYDRTAIAYLSVWLFCVALFNLNISPWPLFGICISTSSMLMIFLTDRWSKERLRKTHV